jgi:hypothetical protein
MFDFKKKEEENIIIKEEMEIKMKMLKEEIRNKHNNITKIKTKIHSILSISFLLCFKFIV